MIFYRLRDKSCFRYPRLYNCTRHERGKTGYATAVKWELFDGVTSEFMNKQVANTTISLYIQVFPGNTPETIGI